MAKVIQQHLDTHAHIEINGVTGILFKGKYSPQHVIFSLNISSRTEAWVRYNPCLHLHCLADI